MEPYQVTLSHKFCELFYQEPPPKSISLSLNLLYNRFYVPFRAYLFVKKKKKLEEFPYDKSRNKKFILDKVSQKSNIRILNIFSLIKASSGEWRILSSF